jgi:2-keto-3-deoxy-galactonokinase
LLLGKITAASVADAISGLLIGTEIRHLRHLAAANPRVALIAAPGLRERYEAALRFFALEPVVFDARHVTARGLAAIHAAMNAR